MMRILFFSVLCFMALFADQKYKDLGIAGAMYEIQEENFLDLIKEGVANLEKEYSQERIKKILSRELSRQSVGHTALPYCEKFRREAGPNYFIVQEDIYNPAGRLYKQKGESVIVENKLPVDFCFIGGTDKQIDRQIDFYNKTVGQMANGDKCIFLVANKNVLKLDEKYYPQMFFPVSKAFEEALGVQCYPTLVHLVGRGRYIFEENMRRFVREGDNR